MPEYNFPGLREGDCWCLCVARWVQAYLMGKAPQVLLEPTHEKTLSYAPLDIHREYKLYKEESAMPLWIFIESTNHIKKNLMIVGKVK
jgi:hypothetical protein